ncbi:hypothetical protein D3C76_1754480 [compost metagenome]
MILNFEICHEACIQSKELFPNLGHEALLISVAIQPLNNLLIRQWNRTLDTAV